MDGIDIYKLLEILIPVILALLSLFFGAKFTNAKGKLNDIADVVSDLSKALEDDKVTPEEMKHIVADIMKIIGKSEEKK